LITRMVFGEDHRAQSSSLCSLLQSLSPSPSYVEMFSSSPSARKPLACMFLPQCERLSLTLMQNNRQT